MATANDPPSSEKKGLPADTKPTPDKATELKAELERSIGSIVQGKSRDQVVSRVLRIVQKAEYFTGPLPHPDHLEIYERACPGAATRIIAMAEKTLNHNSAITVQCQKDDTQDRRLGLVLGFSALLVLCGGALVCALYDKPIIAGSFLAAGAIGTVGRFILGRDHKDSK